MPSVTWTIDFAAQIARLEEGTRKGAAAVKKMADDMESATSFAKNAVIALGAAFGVHSVKEWIHAAAEAGDAAGKMSDRFGIATQKLIGMQYAVALAGGSNDALATGMKKIQDSALAAAQGSAELQQAFYLLGLDADTLLKMPVDQQFAMIIDRLHGVENAGLRNALANKILGKTYGDLMGIVAEGSEAFRQAQKEAEAFGTAISRVDAAKLEIANDAVTRAKEAVKGLGMTIALTVAPIIRVLADHFSDAAIKAHGFRDEVSSGMEQASNAVGAGIWFVERLQFAWAAVRFAVAKVAEVSLSVLAAIADKLEFTTRIASYMPGPLGAVAKLMNEAAKGGPEALSGAAGDAALKVLELGEELDKIALSSKSLDEWQAAVRAAFKKAADDLQADAVRIADARSKFNASQVLPQVKDESAYKQGLAKAVEQIQLQNMTEMELLAQHLLEKQATLDVARANDLIAEDQYQAQKTELTRRYALARTQVEREQFQSLTQMQINNLGLAAGFLQQFAGHSKAAAIAAIALQKAQAAATVIIMTEAAIAQAWARGPEVGAFLEGKLRVQEAISLGLIAATGLAEAANVGSGGAEVGTPANPQIVAPAQSVGSSSPQQSPITTIVQLPPGFTDEQFFSGKTMRTLLEKISDETRRGGRVVIAG